MKPNAELSEEELRSKCIILYKLVTFARFSDIHRISWNSIQFVRNAMRGVYTSRKGDHHVTNWEVIQYDGNPNLCTVSTWKEYLERTKNVERSEDRVFIDIRNPRLEISV